MAVGEQDRRPVVAHDDAGCAGGIVGDVIFLQVLIIDAERAAGEDGKIFARGGQVEDLFVGGWSRRAYFVNERYAPLE